VRAATSDGHLAEMPVTVGDSPVAEPTPAAGPPAPVTVALPADWEKRVEVIMARQVIPLRQQLDAFEAEIRWRDILGGLGWIVGLAGIWVWWRSRGRRGAAS
jgi:nickel transport protein